MNNNLFNFATKELSQDAFICWLCSFAIDDVECEEEALRECARDLVCDFLSVDRGSDVKLLEVKKQVNNIDVLLTAEYNGKRYAIIVEDKVHTSEHDDQLQRYKNTVKVETDTEVIGVYFKTGFQSDYSKVINAGYNIIDRRKILDLFNKYIDQIQNDIFNDFYLYWKNYETIVNSYKEYSLNEWNDSKQVNGFFENMQNELVTNMDCWAGYGWVNNRGGGFWGFWYGYNDDDISIKGNKEASAALYLQVEIRWNYEENHYDYNICLKLERKNGDDESIRNIRNKLIENMKSYGFERPNRVRLSDYMTIGTYKVECSTSDELKECIMNSMEKGLKPLLEMGEIECDC